MTAVSSSDIELAKKESARPKLDHRMGIRTILLFLGVIALGLFFAAYNIYRDVSAARTTTTRVRTY